jgi:hypothetical protein
MRNAFLILVCTIYYSICYSQTDSIKGNASKRIVNDDEIYIFAITLTNDSLAVKYYYVTLPITNIQMLDDYLNTHEIDKKRVSFGIFHKVSGDSLMAVKNILAKHKIHNYLKVMIE